MSKCNTEMKSRRFFGLELDGVVTGCEPLTKVIVIWEGFHWKMKLIQRRAYGYRNFANYRFRVLVECSGCTL